MSRVHGLVKLGVPLLAVALAACSFGGAPPDESVDGGALSSGPDGGALPPDAGRTADAGIPPDDGGVEPDAGSAGDAGTIADAGKGDAGSTDAGRGDAGPFDAGEPDAGGTDAGEPDAGAIDAGTIDAGPVDAGPQDAGPPADAGTGCSSESVDDFCTANAPHCGTVTAADNCGHSKTDNCGLCPALLTSGNFSLIGVTSDDSAIIENLDPPGGFFSASTQDLTVGALMTGGGATLPSGTAVAFVAGSELFVWLLSDTVGIGTLYLWDSGDGLSAGIPNSLVGFGLVSDDGSEIAYTKNASATAQTADLVVANPDLVGPTTLITAMNTAASGTTPCYSSPLSSAGGFSADIFLFVHCPAGSSTATLSSWNGESTPNAWMKTDLATGVLTQPAFDSTGSVAAYVDLSGQLREISIGGGPNAVVSSITPGTSFFVSDSDAVFYVASTGVLSVQLAAGAVPTTLAASAWGILGFADGFSALAYATTQDSGTGLTDVWLDPATDGTGTPFQVVSAASGALSAGGGFTADGSTLLYVSGIGSSGTGTFYALPIASAVSAAAATKRGTGVADVRPAAQTQVVFADRILASQTAGSPRTVDLEVVDVATTAPAVKLGRRLDETFAVTADGVAVFTISASTVTQPTSAEGLYMVSLPQATAAATPTRTRHAGHPR